MKPDRPNFAEAIKRHADFYIERLMKTELLETIQQDYNQIELAYRRVKNEEVGVAYHVGLIETRFLALAELYVPRQLDKLVQGNVTEDDIPEIELAIKSIELGEISYPVNIATLKAMLTKFKTR